MIAKLFNDGWLCRRLGEGEFVPVTLPHDAMIHEQRTPAALGEHNSGWYPGFDYEYVKTFTAPKEWSGGSVTIEFEGVYKNAEVYINGQKAAFRPYGYINFTVSAESYLKYGEQNELRVVARNSDQPNSRWYSGAGIYRDVNLYVGGSSRIEVYGLKIKTLSTEPARVEVSVKTSDGGQAEVVIADGDREVARGVTSAGRAAFTIENAKLWDLDNPHLYTCRALYEGDEAEADFGIRVVGWGKDGFTINGKRVILNGACIHHDNGMLGACAYPSAEERKIRLLKETGYNAVRSAHNPCSKAMLNACDKLGMLVLDEYVDVWYIHKTEHDYVEYFADYWQRDLKDIVDKDYNHPSVIMYSTGNEVSETAQPRGIELTKNMTEYLHSLDDTRPVTCGINIFFNYLSSIGFGVYSDKKAEKAAAKAEKEAEKARREESLGKKKKKKVGSEFFNALAGLLGDKTMKIGATLHGCDVKTRQAFANLDVAGYNYGILRYKHDLKKYPDRLILGSETFCKDTFKFTKLAAENPRIIGDFVWAGMDYIGEAAIGAWEYRNYAPTSGNGYGWITAGSGRLDVTGRGQGEAAYTRVMYGLDKLALAVVPVDTAFEKHSPSAWKMTNAKVSWSWNGCDGKKTLVEVYSRDYRVELYVNGKKAGSKKINNQGRAIFKTRYYTGTVEAVSYDAKGAETARTSLKSASDQTVLSLMPEKAAVGRDELIFLRVAYTDPQLTVKPLIRGDVRLKVEGGELLGFASGCCYTERGYVTDVCDTYYGEALAVIKPQDTGTVKVNAESAIGQASAEIAVTAPSEK